MPRPSWLLDRRTVLRGAGLALALPWLEAMSHAAPAAKRPQRPSKGLQPRFCTAEVLTVARVLV